MHTPLRPSALTVMLQTVTLMRPWGYVEGVDAERVDMLPYGGGF